MKAPLAGGLEWEPSCKRLAGVVKPKKKRALGPDEQGRNGAAAASSSEPVAQTLKREFPFGFKGNTALPSDPGGAGHAPCSESQGNEHAADIE